MDSERITSDSDQSTTRTSSTLGNITLKHFEPITPKPLTNQNIVLDMDEMAVHTFHIGLTDKTREKIFTDPKNLDIRSRFYNYHIWDWSDPTKKGQGMKSEIWGVTRPHLNKFLVWCFTYFKRVIVWSAGRKEYVYGLVDILFRDIAMPHMILTFNDCSNKSQCYSKPLKVIFDEVPEVTAKNTLIADDRDHNFIPNPDNGILVPAYSPKPNFSDVRTDDPALLQLMKWYQTKEVINSTDVRTLDKTKIFSTPLDQ